MKKISTREEHKHSSYNREEIEKSEKCGCFYCLSIFPSSEIVQWIDGNETAICPKCKVDSVLGSAAKFDFDLLKKMQTEWF